MGRSSWLSDPVSGVVRLAGCARLHLVPLDTPTTSILLAFAQVCAASEVHDVCLCTTDSEQGFAYVYLGLARM